jgi:hypothetical protein
MAPKKVDSCSRSLRRFLASVSSIAGHGVQGEPGGHFGDPARALGDDHEVHDHQDGEDNHADDVVAAHHQLAEGLDHMAGAVDAFVAMAEDQPRGRDAQR